MKPQGRKQIKEFDSPVASRTEEKKRGAVEVVEEYRNTRNYKEIMVTDITLSLGNLDENASKRLGL